MPRTSGISDTARIHGWLLVVAVVGSALVYGPGGGVDGIAVSKATVIVIAAIVGAATAGFAAIRSAVVRLPHHPATIAVGVLALAMIVRVGVAADPVRGLLGTFGRWNGLGVYLASLVLFTIAAARADDRSTVRFLRAAVVGSVVVVVFALDEAYAGLGPSWARPASQVAGTLGNPNFFGAWAACMVGPALVLTLHRGQRRSWRIVSAVTLGLLLWAFDVSRARQAIYVVVLVILLVGLGWAVDRLSRRMFGVLAAISGAAVLGGAVLTVVGVRGQGPASFLSVDRSVIRRIHHWQVSGRMIAEHPVGGVGPGMWADRYREFRSLDEAMFDPALARAASSAHNAPLQVVAEWGIVVGLVYLAVLALVTAAMVRELKQREGLPRLLYAAPSALWLGYLLQSLVSIDTPALVVLGWVAGGLVLAPQVRRHASWSLPWRAWKRNRRHPTPRKARAAHAAVAGMMLLAVWVALLPLRADAASSGGEVQVDPESANGPPASTRATELAPWEERYWQHLGAVLYEEGEAQLAASVFEHAYATGPDNFAVVVNAARVSEEVGDTAQARRYYERALEQEPHVPELRVEVAEFALEQGDRGWAEELVEDALRADPDYGPALELRDEL